MFWLLRTRSSSGKPITQRALLTSRSWRSQFRTDRLYSEINFVLARFCQPYYELFSHVDRLLSTPGQALPAGSSVPLLAQSLLLLIQLFHDLSAQDLPPFFEENMAVFMGDPGQGKEGWLRKYLSWERGEIKGDVSGKIRVSMLKLAGRRRGARDIAEDKSVDMRDCRALRIEVLRCL